MYMVQLGTFKTATALRETYYAIPEKLRPRVLVCRSGQYWTLEVGGSEKPQEVDAVFKKFKDMGLEAMVVKMDPATCQSATSWLSGVPAQYTAPEQIVGTKSEAPRKSEDRPYSDLSDPRVRRLIPPGGVRVLPEVTTKVVLSNRDVNRITCSEGPIKDIIYSKEKGITVKTEGNDAFVKFLIPRDPMTGELKYATAPSEFYVVCGEASTIYTLIALPRNVPAQAVQLVSTRKRINKNISILQGIPFEKKVVLMVKTAYRDEIPESFTVRRVDKSFDIFRYVAVRLNRTVTAEGEGLILNEYVITLKPGFPGTQRRLKETLFLTPELAQHPVGIALEYLILRKGQPSRLFIVERTTQQ